MEEFEEEQNNQQDEEEQYVDEKYTDEKPNQIYLFCDNDNGIKTKGRNKYNNITRKQNKKIQNDKFVRNKLKKRNIEQLNNTYIDDDDLKEIEFFEKTKRYIRKINELEKMIILILIIWSKNLVKFIIKIEKRWMRMKHKYSIINTTNLNWILKVLLMRCKNIVFLMKK